ncbi:hypothetical protein DVH24_011109 [Malus domestica]|uniref:Uncharacterized protein n=1 Tax=Malus domestica TaxID=3750 RepID=A0A498JYB6_MALDO|nr:hypothetical protein DVH24_011109 [Malus domestica]
MEVYSKQGKLKNWLAVCCQQHLVVTSDGRERWSLKAKTLSCIRYKAMILIRGPNIMQTLIKSQDWTADFKKVFDVILEEVVNANLKPDKMVKKVLALTTYKHFLTGSNLSFWGETVSLSSSSFCYYFHFSKALLLSLSSDDTKRVYI